MTAVDPFGSRAGWYLRRAASMSPAEVLWRARDQVIRVAWSRRQVTRGQDFAEPPAFAGELGLPVVLPALTADLVPDEARNAVLVSADRLIKGEWEVLGFPRDDMIAPDWFFDPVTGLRAPSDRYAFRINHRSQEQTGNIKQIWEISRLHHLTLLAAAWFLSHDDRYARRVAQQLFARGGGATPFLVRAPLDERHRDRRSADQHGLDPATA